MLFSISAIYLDAYIWIDHASFYRSSQLEALSSSAATGASSVAPSSKFVLDRVGSAKARARKERLNGEHVLKRRISVSKHETNITHHVHIGRYDQRSVLTCRRMARQKIYY